MIVNELIADVPFSAEQLTGQNTWQRDYFDKGSTTNTGFGGLARHDFQRGPRCAQRPIRGLTK
jgi:hypothetical protein